MSLPFDENTTVAEAALILDGEDENWFKKVNIATLNMHNGYQCILGQISGNHYEYHKFGNHSIPEKAHNNGPFGYKGCKEKWIEEIQNRLIESTITLESGCYNTKCTQKELDIFVRISKDLGLSYEVNQLKWEKIL